MDRYLNSTTVGLTLLLCGAQALPTAQAAECAKPDGERINKALKLDVPYLSAERLAVTEYRGKKLQWVSASWTGPIGGELVIMDCTGRVLDGIEAGAVDGGKAVSIAGYPYPVLRTSAQTMSGTDQAHAYTESLFSFNGKKIVNLWKHETEVYGFQLCSDSTIENYDIAASADLHTITVTGILKHQHGKIVKGECSSDMAVTKTVKLPSKHYCWNGKRYAKSRSRCLQPARKGR